MTPSILEREIDEAINQGLLLTMAEDLKAIKQGGKAKEVKPQLNIVFEKPAPEIQANEQAEQTAKEQEAVLRIKRTAIEQEERERKALREQMEKERQGREKANKEQQERQDQEQKQSERVRQEQIIKEQKEKTQAENILREKAKQEEIERQKSQDEKDRQQKEAIAKAQKEREEKERLAKEREEKEREEKEREEKEREEQKTKAISDKKQRWQKRQELLQKQGQIEKELKVFEKQSAPLEAQAKRYQDELQGIVLKINVLLEREKAQAQQKEAQEEVEKQAKNEKEKQIAERKRQKLEAQRRQVEKERWFWQLKQAQAKESLALKQKELKEIKEKSACFVKTAKEIKEQLETLSLQDSKDVLTEEINSLQTELAKSQQEAEQAKEKTFSIEKALADLSVKEEEIQSNVFVLEKEIQEKRFAGEQVSKEEEKNLWGLEDQRAKTEKNRWVLGAQKEQAEKNLALLEKNIQTIISQISQKQEKIEKIGILLEYGVEEGQKILKQKAKEKEVKVEHYEEKAPQGLPIEEDTKEEEQPKEPEMTKSAREQAEIVKASQSQKDTAQERAIIEEIREKAREKQRAVRLENIRRQAFLGKGGQLDIKGPLAKEEILKRLSDISPKEEEERQKFLQRIETNVKFQPAVDNNQTASKSSTEIIFRPVIRKPAFLEKLLVRLLTIIIIIGVLLGFYFVFKFFNNRHKIAETITPPAVENNIVEPEPSLPVAPEIEKEELPAPFFNVALQEPIDFNNPQEIPSLLKTQLLLSDLQEGQYKQIGFRYLESGKIADSSIFFLAFQTVLPENIKDILQAEEIYFIYQGQKGRRLGIVFKQTDTAKLSKEISDWQDDISADMENLAFALFNKNKPIKNKFVSLAYQNKTVYCLTYSTDDEGICYAVFDNYFLLGSSAELMEKTINNLNVMQ